MFHIMLQIAAVNHLDLRCSVILSLPTDVVSVLYYTSGEMYFCFTML